MILHFLYCCNTVHNHRHSVVHNPRNPDVMPTVKLKNMVFSKIICPSFCHHNFAAVFSFIRAVFRRSSAVPMYQSDSDRKP